MNLSEGPAAETLAGLALELDGTDVTALLTVDGTAISVVPVVPLSPGTHRITLYLVAGESFRVLGEWSFEIAATGADAGSGYSLEIDALHEASAIVSSAGSEHEGDHYRATNAGSADLEALDGRLSAGANYLLETEADARPTDRVIDLGEYFFELQQQTGDLAASLRLGHQAVDYDDILISDLHSRGAGISVSTIDQMVSVAAFGVNPEDQLVGIENFTGVEEPDDRVFGGAVTFRPFGPDLALTASGYGGRATDLDGVTVGEGHGGALSAEAMLLDGRLRLNASGGWTRSDADAGGGVIDAESGYAVRSLVSYDLLTGITEDGSPAPTLTLSAGYDRIEESYFSYAFQGLATGRQSVFTDAYYANGPFNLDVHALYQTDNVENDPNFPTNRLIDLSASAYRQLFAEGGGPEWLGQASLDASLQFQTQDQVEGSIFALPDEDFTTISTGLGFNSFHDDWGWNLRYAFADHDDRSDFDFDERRHSVTLGLSLTPVAGWASGYVADVYATATAVELNQDADRADFDIGASLVAPLIPDRLSLASSYQVSFSTGWEGLSGGSMTTDLAWTVFDGVEFVARTGVQHGDSAFSGSGTDYYGGLVLRISTPYSLPGGDR